MSEGFNQKRESARALNGSEMCGYRACAAGRGPTPEPVLADGVIQRYVEGEVSNKELYRQPTTEEKEDFLRGYRIAEEWEKRGHELDPDECGPIYPPPANANG